MTKETSSRKGLFGTYSFRGIGVPRRHGGKQGNRQAHPDPQKEIERTLGKAAVFQKLMPTFSDTLLTWSHFLILPNSSNSLGPGSKHKSL